MRLPDARSIVVADPRTALAELPRAARAHDRARDARAPLDAECLRVALGLDAFYLGMIGSRRRATHPRASGEGADRERVAAVHAPIGLDIGAGRRARSRCRSSPDGERCGVAGRRPRSRCRAAAERQSTRREAPEVIRRVDVDAHSRVVDRDLEHARRVPRHHRARPSSSGVASSSSHTPARTGRDVRVGRRTTAARSAHRGVSDQAEAAARPSRAAPRMIDQAMTAASGRGCRGAQRAERDLQRRQLPALGIRVAQHARVVAGRQRGGNGVVRAAAGDDDHVVRCPRRARRGRCARKFVLVHEPGLRPSPMRRDAPPARTIPATWRLTACPASHVAAGQVVAEQGPSNAPRRGSEQRFSQLLPSAGCCRGCRPCGARWGGAGRSPRTRARTSCRSSRAARANAPGSPGRAQAGRASRRRRSRRSASPRWARRAPSGVEARNASPRLCRARRRQSTVAPPTRSCSAASRCSTTWRSTLAVARDRLVETLRLARCSASVRPNLRISRCASPRPGDVAQLTASVSASRFGRRRCCWYRRSARCSTTTVSAWQIHDVARHAGGAAHADLVAVADHQRLRAGADDALGPQPCVAGLVGEVLRQRSARPGRRGCFGSRNRRFTVLLGVPVVREDRDVGGKCPRPWRWRDRCWQLTSSTPPRVRGHFRRADRRLLRKTTFEPFASVRGVATRCVMRATVDRADQLVRSGRIGSRRAVCRRRNDGTSSRTRHHADVAWHRHLVGAACDASRTPAQNCSTVMKAGL